MFKKLILLFALFVLFLPIKSSAQETTERIISFDSKITINTNSSIDVKETIEYYFPSSKHGIFRTIPYRYIDETNKQYFQTPITILSVTNDKNTPWQYSKSTDGNYLTLKIGDPNKTINGRQTYVISYNVLGVINYFDDHDELYWNVTGYDWEVPIGKVTTQVGLLEDIDYTKLQLACYTGATGSKEQNCTKSYETGKADFSAGQGPLTIVVGWNKGILTAVERQYDQPSDFDKLWNKIHYESAWFLLLPIIVLILLLIRYYRSGRDPFGRGTIAPEFEPPDGLKPAEMGTLIDEKADNQDISSTIIDLAVRGYLKIKEKDKKYTLIKTKDANGQLQDFEKDIFKNIFNGASEVELKNIHETFADKIGNIKQDLYNRLVDVRQYFFKNPDKVRKKWYLGGCLVMFFSPVLFIFSIILATASFISGILVLAFGHSTPKKTREGVIAKEKSLGFKEFLYRAERYRVQWQEKERIFEKYLPYAMVFGITEVWAKNFQDIYKQPPDWYEGDWTTFNAVYLATSLNSFSNTASTAYSPPSTTASSGGSGFGGGGSSGGGMGGGGGGSW